MKVSLHRRWTGAMLAMAFLAVARDAAAQVQVTLRTLYPVEAIYISDLTPNSANSNPGLFDITLINGSAAGQSVVLQFTVTLVQPTRAQIFSGTTDPFQLTGSVRRISTRDLFGRGDVAIKDYTIEPEGEVLDQVLQSGRLPSGTYIFAVDIRTPQGVALGHDELQIDIGNPSRIEPLSPGRRFGEAPPTVQPTGLRFLWTTEGHAAGAQYRLRVVRVEGATSEEEAMQGNASWVTLTPATSEFYPASSAALRLEPGATYAWQVTREVSSSSGVERVNSPVFWFRIGGPGIQTVGGGADEAVRLRVLDMLRNLGFGPELAGFRPVSATLADGRVLSFETLEALIAAIQSGQIALASIRVR